jgi:hypothetical protein
LNSENADEWVPPVRRHCPRRARLAARRCRVAATRPRIKCAVRTARRCPDSAAPFRPRRRRCLNRLASPRPIPTVPSPLSEAAPPPYPYPVTVRPSSAVASFIHSERRPSLPLVVSFSWSVELTFPSLLTVAGPPLATVAPPHRKKNTTVEPDFFPHRRRGAPVSYLPLPHARRVASPSWVLDHRRLRRLRRCGVADGRATTRAQES